MAVRWKAILKAAARVFLREGYNSASIAKIALEAGVSNKTIYTQYPSKVELMADVLRDRFEKSWERIDSLAAGRDQSLEQVLLEFTKEVSREATSPMAVGLYRVLIAENPTAKVLSEIYESIRIAHWDLPLSQILQASMEKNKLRRVNPQELGRALYHLAISNLRERALLGHRVTQADIDRQSAFAVDTILSAYSKIQTT
jgi:AcrR family transcriptional regulator